MKLATKSPLPCAARKSWLWGWIRAGCIYENGKEKNIKKKYVATLSDRKGGVKIKIV